MRIRINIAQRGKWHYLGEYEVDRVPNLGEWFSPNHGSNDRYKVVHICTTFGSPSLWDICAVKAKDTELLQYTQL